MAQILSVLFEHASGYALFRVKEFEEVGMLIPQVEEAVSKLAKFNSVIKLTAFSPFRSGTNALDNINSISEGVLHEDLHVFLETNFPKPGKKQKFILGVSDNRIAAAITENMSIMCQCTGVVLEIIRGIRLHFPHFIQGLTDKTQVQAQLGLGHSYSRAKVKFNIHRVDNMIIQSISLLDQLDKDINTFSMRIREWYSYHFPELIKLVTDNYSYARVVKTINIRSKITEEKVDQLEEILLDRSKAVAIQNASKMSMGMDISPIDLLNIELFASRVIALAEYRKNLMDYLSTKMTQVAPSLTSLIGEQVGARLIAHAGSLTNLAKYPSSTVQILGAEKALFRALKNKGNTPKYGLIFHSTFIGRAAPKNKGRISRYLANKCSLASRIDCFSDFPNSVFGVHLRMQVEDRLKFYETGTPPQKNVDVMKVALKEFSVLYANFTKKEKKRKKKEKKLSLEMSMALENGEENSIVAEERPKKKRKLAEMEDEPVVPNSVAKVNDDELPKKKKKRKLKGKVGAAEQNPETEILTEKSRKEISERIEEETETVSPKKKKNKNKMKGGKLKEPAPTENNINQAKKKKNKKPCKEEIEVMEAEVTFEEKRAKSAKKKKKKKISNF